MLVSTAKNSCCACSIQYCYFLRNYLLWMILSVGWFFILPPIFAAFRVVFVCAYSGVGVGAAHKRLQKRFPKPNSRYGYAHPEMRQRSTLRQRAVVIIVKYSYVVKYRYVQDKNIVTFYGIKKKSICFVDALYYVTILSPPLCSRLPGNPVCIWHTS